MTEPAEKRDQQRLKALRDDPERDRVLRLLSDLSEFLRRQDDPARYTLNKLWHLLNEKEG